MTPAELDLAYWPVYITVIAVLWTAWGVIEWRHK